MTKEQPDTEVARDPAQEVERIRDIIFGSQMRDYEGRFQTLQRDLDRLQGEIDRLSERLAEQESTHNKQLGDLRQEMRQADDELRDEVRETTQCLTTDKVDRTVLGDLFIELGRQVKADGSLTDLVAELEDLEQG
jgi:predicted RNase H-like nuclease (RuvC/YqgF family)